MRQRFEAAGIIQTEKTKSGYLLRWVPDGETPTEVQPEAAEINQDPF
jgi:hypothetical protein